MGEILIAFFQRLARIAVEHLAGRLGCRVVANHWRSAAELRHETGRVLAKAFKGQVQSGPLKGFRISETSVWGAGDVGARVLGTYEVEIQAELVGLAGRYPNLVDLGAADGFFCVGFVELNYFQRSWAFEASDVQRRSLQQLIEDRGLAKSVTVLGLADSQFAVQLARAGVNWAESVLLCDIEGGEFDVLTEESLPLLAQTPLIVELHPFAATDGDERVVELRRLVTRTHLVKTVVQKSRQFFESAEVAALPDDARWLSLSEGRPRQMEWLVCLPKTDHVV